MCDMGLHMFCHYYIALSIIIVVILVINSLQFICHALRDLSFACQSLCYYVSECTKNLFGDHTLHICIHHVVFKGVLCYFAIVQCLNSLLCTVHAWSVIIR